MKKLIINADDFGMSKGINYAIIDAFKYGVISSTTICANGKAFEHAVNLYKENKEIAVGVHLNITEGKPILNSKSLIDEKGYFKLENRNKVYKIDLEELYLELKAQIDKVIKSGIKVSHFDSHHYIHEIPAFREVIMRIANEYKLPYRSIKGEKGFTDGYYKTKELFLLDNKKADKIEDKIIVEGMETLVNAFKKYDFLEIIAHLGFVDSDLLKMAEMTEERVNQRMNEYNLYTNKTLMKTLIKEKNIKILNYHQI